MTEAECQKQLDVWIDKCLSGGSFTEKDRQAMSDFFREVGGESLLSSDWQGLGEEETAFRFHSPTLAECLERTIEAVTQDSEDHTEFDMEYALEKFKQVMLSNIEDDIGNTYFALRLEDSRGRVALLICRNEYFWQGGSEDIALTICVDSEAGRRYLASLEVVDAMSYPKSSGEAFTDESIIELIEAARKNH